jgi:protein-S-isoprenylcysteine O-methyltransferase Ste14
VRSGDRATEGGTPPAAGCWIATATLVVLVVATQIVDTTPAPLMRGLALTLLGLAVVFAGLPFIQLRRYGAVPPGQSYMETTTVARRGLYAIVRHPQYLGCDFLAWGLAASAPHWGTILPAIVVTVAFSRQARAEERYLIEKCGDDYRAYRRTVPRFGLLTGLLRWVRRTRRDGQARP